MDEEIKRLAAIGRFIGSKNYSIIKDGQNSLDAIAMYCFTLFQDGKISKDEYHNLVVALMDTKNCFDLLEIKMVESLRPKKDKFEF